MSRKSIQLIQSAIEIEIRAAEVAIRESPKRDYWRQPMFDVREAHIADCRLALKELNAIRKGEV